MKLINICEVRKNPHLNPKSNVMSYILNLAKNIKDTNDDINLYFISYMNTNKTGINPSTEFNTPPGLYCYPLSWTVQQITSNATQGLFRSLDMRPYPYEKVKYIKIYKVINHTKVFKVEDELSSSQQQFAQTFLNLPKIRLVADAWKGFYETFSGINVSVKLLNFVRKLKIDAIIDNGHGIIHPEEPTQAVFFNTTILENIDIHNETSNFDIINKKDITIKHINELLYTITDHNSRTQQVILSKLSKILDEKTLTNKDKEMLMLPATHSMPNIAAEEFIAKLFQSVTDNDLITICNAVHNDYRFMIFLLSNIISKHLKTSTINKLVDIMWNSLSEYITVDKVLNILSYRISKVSEPNQHTLSRIFDIIRTKYSLKFNYQEDSTTSSDTSALLAFIQSNSPEITNNVEFKKMWITFVYQLIENGCLDTISQSSAKEIMAFYNKNRDVFEQHDE